MVVFRRLGYRMPACRGLVEADSVTGRLVRGQRAVVRHDGTGEDVEYGRLETAASRTPKAWLLMFMASVAAWAKLLGFAPRYRRSPRPRPGRGSRPCDPLPGTWG